MRLYNPRTDRWSHHFRWNGAELTGRTAIGRVTAQVRSERKSLDGAMLIDDEENILQALAAGVALQSVFHAGDETASTALRQSVPANVPVFEVARRTGIVVLDQVGISGNVGAIIRTSLARYAGAVVLLDTDAVDVYDRRLIRASRGYVFALRVVTATTEDLIAFCKPNGRPLAVAMPRAPMPVAEISSLSEGLAIVLGGEKSGCSQALRDAATLAFEIPTSPAVESLNVSSAAAMTLYCRYRFNRAAKP